MIEEREPNKPLEERESSEDTVNKELQNKQKKEQPNKLVEKEKTEVKEVLEELKEKKGNFPEPFENFSFEVEVKDRSVFVVLINVEVTEIGVTVTGLGETVTLRKILQKGKVRG